MSTNVSFADVHNRSLHPALSARAFDKSCRVSPVSDRACLHEPTRPTLKTDVIEYNTLKMTSHKHIDNAGRPLGGAFNESDTFRNSYVAAMPFE